jgi:hypothetical protein
VRPIRPPVRTHAASGRQNARLAGARGGRFAERSIFQVRCLRRLRVHVDNALTDVQGQRGCRDSDEGKELAMCESIKEFHCVLSHCRGLRV